MTIPEITAYVMGLSVDDVRRLSATDVMGWTWGGVDDYDPETWWLGMNDQLQCRYHDWRPDEDRNQSRMVDIRAIDLAGGVNFILAVGAVLKTCLLSGDWLTADGEVQILALLGITPLDETRAGLIAHMIHKEEATNE